MVDWVKWVVPLIALVVWILANLLRVPEQPKQQRRIQRPVPPPEDDPFLQDENPRSDLDRFILEAKKRREQEEQRKSQPRSAPPPIIQPRTSQPTSQTQSRQPSQRQSNRGAPPPLPKNMPGSQTSRPQSKPPRPPQPSSPSLRRQYEEIVQTYEAKTDEEDRRAKEREAYARLQQERSEQLMKSAQPSEAAQSIAQMLSNPKSARVAIALREILDKPLARRRR